jgi:hypothetical protein
MNSELRELYAEIDYQHGEELDAFFQEGFPHSDCPRCKGTGECSNAQFRCMCRWHRRGCALVHGVADCDCRNDAPSLP